MIKHGKRNTRIYGIYQKMKQRCYNKNNSNYIRYGARGIKICDEWLDKENGFINFYNWSMRNGYTDKLTIDRINNDGNYEPSNCRWVTNKIQSNNRRSNIFITYKNKTQTMTEWADEFGISRERIRNKLQKGLSMKEIEKGGVKKYNTKPIFYNGEYYKLNTLCKKYGIPNSTFRYNLSKGLSVDEIISTLSKIKKK